MYKDGVEKMLDKREKQKRGKIKIRMEGKEKRTGKRKGQKKKTDTRVT